MSLSPSTSSYLSAGNRIGLNSTEPEEEKKTTQQETNQEPDSSLDQAISTPADSTPDSSLDQAISTPADSTPASSPPKKNVNLGVKIAKTATEVTEAGAIIAEIADKAAVAADASVAAGAAEATGALSIIAAVTTFGVAGATLFTKVLPARRRLVTLNSTVTMLKNAAESLRIGEDINENDIKDKLKKYSPPLNIPENSLTQDNIDELLKELEKEKPELKMELARHTATMTFFLGRAATTLVDGLSKLASLALVGLKMLGYVTGVLLIATAIVNIVHHAKNLHTKNVEIKNLQEKINKETNPKEKRKLETELKILKLERKKQIFALAMSCVELILGIAFTIANTTTGGAAMPVIAGLLACASIIGLVGTSILSKRIAAAKADNLRESPQTTIGQTLNDAVESINTNKKPDTQPAPAQ